MSKRNGRIVRRSKLSGFKYFFNDFPYKVAGFIAGLVILFLFIMFFNFQELGRITARAHFARQVVAFAEKNENIIFTIDEITFFSSANAKNRATSQTNFTLQNLYTYTDIAFFINNNSDEFTPENTIKTLKITNLEFNTPPGIGEPNIYYKNLHHFTRSDLVTTYLLEDELVFNVTSDDSASFESPILFNNLANPITLTYQNENLKTDFTFTDVGNPITYNGSLLKRAGISLSAIQVSISFDIYITNHNDEEFKTTVSFTIPYENGDSSIFDGSIIVEQETFIRFYRIR